MWTDSFTNKDQFQYLLSWAGYINGHTQKICIPKALGSLLGRVIVVQTEVYVPFSR
jgi:hypothetical protein